MITNKQKEWLEQYLKDYLTERDPHRVNPHKTYIYLQRIQERIDRMLDNALWLAENAPWIFTDETTEIISIDTNNPLPRHRRLKKLITIIKLLYPNVNIWLEEDNFKKNSN